MDLQFTVGMKDEPVVVLQQEHWPGERPEVVNVLTEAWSVGVAPELQLKALRPRRLGRHCSAGNGGRQGTGATIPVFMAIPRREAADFSPVAATRLTGYLSTASVSASSITGVATKLIMSCHCRVYL